MANPEKQQKTEKPETAKTEIAAPRPMHSAAPPDTLSELEQLRAENARLKTERRQLEAAMRAAAEKVGEETQPVSGASFRNAAGLLVDEKYRGVKQYRVGAAGAYREGRHYSEGEIITLVDATPSRTWTPYEKPVAAPAVVEAAAGEGSRAADTTI